MTARRPPEHDLVTEELAAGCTRPPCQLWQRTVGMDLIVIHGGPTSETALVLNVRELRGSTPDQTVARVLAWLKTVHDHERTLSSAPALDRPNNS